VANKETKLRIVVDAENRTQGAFSAVQRNLDEIKQNHAGLISAMKTVGTAGTIAFASLTAGLALAVRETMANEAAQNRLAHILKTSRGATDDQVAALLRQASALQKVGVVASESIVQTQAQLATFDLTADAIERLTPAILDYVVAEKGASASTEDFKQLTNGLAQALNGNFTSLTQTGFVLDEATRQLIANGTEAERTAALVKVLNSTYEGFNAAARDTAEGSLVALRNEFRDMVAIIGDQFIPILHAVVAAIRPVVESVGRWVEENPVLARNILIVAVALTGLMALLLPLAFALPGLILMFTGIGAAIAFVTAMSAPMILAIGGIILVLGALASQGYLTKEAWQDVWLGIKIMAAEGANAVIGTTETMVNFIISGVNKAIEAINSVIRLANRVPGVNIQTMGTIGSVAFDRFDTGLIAANDMRGRAGSGTVINVSGNTFLDEYGAQRVGDLIVQRLKLSNPI
jgi:hypothetical protein